MENRKLLQTVSGLTEAPGPLGCACSLQVIQGPSASQATRAFLRSGLSVEQCNTRYDFAQGLRYHRLIGSHPLCFLIFPDRSRPDAAAPVRNLRGWSR